jgi:hypothetical protein
MMIRPPGRRGIGFLLALSLVGAGCSVAPTVPTTASSSPRVDQPVAASDFPEPARSDPPAWSRLLPAEPVRAPFGGIGNQFIFATVAYASGFVAVGEDLQFNGPVDGTIWSSPDGASWERLATAINDLANAEIDNVTASGARLVAIGGPRAGDQSWDGSGRIVWISDDGRSWRRVGDEALFDGASPTGLAGGPAGFVAWGDVDRQTLIFHSDDGVSWTRLSTGDLFDGSVIAAVKPYRGGFVAVGAHLPPPSNDLTVGGPDLSTAAAWWSPDGRTWESATVDQGFGLGSVHVGADGMIGLGGGGCGGCIGPAAMWRSADGRTWRHVGDDVPHWPAYASDGARIVRDDWQDSGDVFESTDGITWQPIGTHRPVDSYGLTVGANGILMTESIGRGGAPDENDAGVWYLAAG